jgi:ketosteroid isomerase-like protein
MHKWQILTSIFVLLFVCEEVAAGDKEDVVATFGAILDGFTNGDMDAAQKRISPEAYAFPGGGGLLVSIGSADVGVLKGMQRYKEKVEAGYRAEQQRLHSDVKVYGDTAILTEYHMKRRTFPDGTTQNVKLRITAVLVKQKGQWKLVHHHNSLLFPDYSE